MGIHEELEKEGYVFEYEHGRDGRPDRVNEDG